LIDQWYNFQKDYRKKYNAKNISHEVGQNSMFLKLINYNLKRHEEDMDALTPVEMRYRLLQAVNEEFPVSFKPFILEKESLKINAMRDLQLSIGIETFDPIFNKDINTYIEKTLSLKKIVKLFNFLYTFDCGKKPN
jgi:hypothetical protein